MRKIATSRYCLYSTKAAATTTTNNAMSKQQQGNFFFMLSTNLDKWSWPVKPHVNFADMVEKKQAYIENAVARKMTHINVQQVIQTYEDNLSIQNVLNHLRHVRKAVATIISMDMLKNEQQKQATITELQHYIKTRLAANQQLKSLKNILEQQQVVEWTSIGKQIKEEVTTLEAQVLKNQEYLQEEGTKVPNLSHTSVPVGEEPATIRVVGSMPQVDVLPTELLQLRPNAKRTKFYDHVEICDKLDLLDFESASFVSGPKQYYLKNEAVLLELALVQYTLNKLVSRGFTPITVPEIVRRQIMEGCGFQPRGEHSQIYNLEGEESCLIGTSEISLAGLFTNKIVQGALPKKFVGLSHCFRKEAGASQTDKGLYRVHQFTKVEMFVYSSAEQSEALHQELVNLQAEIFTELGFHFVMLNMPCHDLGAPASIKVDLEAYMPGRGSFGEVSSASNCTDYQARRLFIRTKGKDKNEYVHTLNGTAVATPRAILTILEQFQYEVDGKMGVWIPPVLRPYLPNQMALIEQK